MVSVHEALPRDYSLSQTEKAAKNDSGAKVRGYKQIGQDAQVGPTSQDLKIGDRLELIPGYGDLTTVLHNQFFVLQNGKLVDIWPLTARGRLA